MSRGQRRGAVEVDVEYEPFCPGAKIMRPWCPECRGAVEWMSLGEACDSLGFAQVNAFLDMLGSSLDRGFEDDEEMDFWRCRKCGEMGVLHGE